MLGEFSGYIVVLITAASGKEADVLAEKLLDAKLAACVNITGVNSFFSWQGKKESSAEVLLIVKTRYELFSQLEVFVKKNHSYEVPEIIALPIIAASREYLEWIKDSTK
ncbi:MAG: divalent-cation tolerance protein CutA [Candidatus Omnitrophica bacterium]|nr:divalent-cation tolerance protein CutA [Candidatus Omnitrophota bacterium]